MAPQIIYLFLSLCVLLIGANEHGKEKTGKHNFWINLISVIIYLSILICGGFFDVFIHN